MRLKVMPDLALLKSIRILALPKSFAVAALLLLAPIQSAQACSCAWAGPFASVAHSADLVVRGKVLSYKKNSMKVTVLEVLRGRESRRTIRIWGDNGAQCSPYVSSFPIGTEWVFAVRRTTSEAERGYFKRENTPEEWKKWGDFRISICGEFWLQVTGSKAVGIVRGTDLAGPKEEISLRDLRQLLTSKSSKPPAS